MLPALRSATLPGKANQGMNLKTFDDPFHLSTIIGKDVQTSTKPANWMPTLQQTCFKFNDSMTRGTTWAKLTTSLVINSTRYLCHIQQFVKQPPEPRDSLDPCLAFVTSTSLAYHLTRRFGPCHPSSCNENYNNVASTLPKFHMGPENGTLE